MVMLQAMFGLTNGPKAQAGADLCLKEMEQETRARYALIECMLGSCSLSRIFRGECFNAREIRQETNVLHKAVRGARCGSCVLGIS